MNDKNTTEMQTTVDVVEKLKSELPEILGQAQVVGQWIWLEFTGPKPTVQTRIKLKQLGFHWNRRRRCWQHPCGAKLPNDPRETGKYRVTAATELKVAAA